MKTAYEKLTQFQKNYPELTFQNNGYEYLSRDIQERHEEQIKEISEVLKNTIDGFKSFNNFQPTKDSFNIRVQYLWSSSFTGVGYFNIELFKE